MNTSEKAPRTSGRVARAACSTPLSGLGTISSPAAAPSPGATPCPGTGPAPSPPGAAAGWPSRASRAPSLSATASPGIPGSMSCGGAGGTANRAVSTSVSEVAWPGPAARAPASAASSRVLVRLPLWPRARLVVGVARKVGWAFSQIEDAAGGVAAVPDGDVPAQRVQHRLVEDLRNEAHVLVDDDAVPVADRDPGRLLAAVLERVQAEVGELGDFLVRGPGAEHAAGVPGRVVGGVEIVVQTAIRLDHVVSVDDAAERPAGASRAC